jgi:hypothetical protein
MKLGDEVTELEGAVEPRENAEAHDDGRRIERRRARGK